MGQRGFEREFGRRAEVGWLPDTFGFSGNLPQIMAGCGLKYFFTCKIYWQSRDVFPHRLFWWEGIDGARVLAHAPRLRFSYNGRATPQGLLGGWKNFAQRQICDELVFPFGHGDGGGGVTRDMLERIRRFRGLAGLPRCEIGTAAEALHRMHRQVADTPELPVWRGELYLETHRGTFTSKAILKRLNRQAEALYLTTEKLASLLLSAGIEPELDGLADGWEKILTNQFHDIMAGTSDKEIHEDAVRDFQAAMDTGRRLLAANLEKLGKAVDTAGKANPALVFNPLSWPRDDLVEVEFPRPLDDAVITDSEGRDLDCQILDRQSGKVLIALQEMPSLGYAVLDAGRGRQKALPGLEVTRERLENRFYSITLLPTGELTILDKVRGRDVFEPGRTGNALQFFRESPDRESAWNIDRDFERHLETVAGADISVVERGPLRAAVRVTKHFARSTVEQDVVIYRDLPRVDFLTRVDWQESHVMLKAAFPVNARSLTATFEIAYGSLERPTHTNTSWDQEKFEVPAQRWADLSEPGFGVAILNDCKYGYDVRGNVLRLTLLRAPGRPEPDADRGRHEFRYALVTHGGDWRRAGIVRMAAEFNIPTVSRALAPEPGPLSPQGGFADTDAGNVIIEAVKKAEESDGIVARLYECHGARGHVTVNFGFPVAAVREANMLEDVGEAIETEQNQVRFFIRPFEIKTLLVEPA